MRELDAVLRSFADAQLAGLGGDVQAERGDQVRDRPAHRGRVLAIRCRVYSRL